VATRLSAAVEAQADVWSVLRLEAQEEVKLCAMNQKFLPIEEDPIIIEHTGIDLHNLASPHKPLAGRVVEADQIANLKRCFDVLCLHWSALQVWNR
jgi:hypothetical protein